MKSKIQFKTNFLFLNFFSFNFSFGELPFSKKHKGDYVKFTKETLNEMLGQFFEGHQSSKKTPKK